MPETRDLSDVLADAREEAAVLRRNGAGFSVERVERLLSDVQDAAEEWQSVTAAAEIAQESIIARFWRHVLKTDGCWLWTGHTVSGYGQFSIGAVKFYAHRVSWEMAFGPVPTGLYVYHHCDTPLCVCPSHLFVGTAGDNSRDASAKGRLVRPRATHCKYSHELTPENTTTRGNSGYVRCLTCAREATRKSKERRVNG